MPDKKTLGEMIKYPGAKTGADLDAESKKKARDAEHKATLERDLAKKPMLSRQESDESPVDKTAWSSFQKGFNKR